MKQINFRFWTSWRGNWVKLTLKPNQVLSASFGGRTDEGWASEHEQWEHVGNGIVRQWCSDGSDCDGRLTRTGSDFCHANDLAKITVFPCVEYNNKGEEILKYNRPEDYHNNALIHRPDWQEFSKERVFDEYATLANY